MAEAYRALVAALLLLFAMPAAAQESSISWLVGSWRGSGTMMGHASEATLEVNPTLNGQFLELHYQAGRFEGRAFYRPARDGRWSGHWFDNRGAAFTIDGVMGGQTLTANWGAQGVERGRTVYRRLDDGRLEVTDSVPARDGGGWREFARHVLQKAD